VVWMDGLDVPLTKALNAIFFQMGTDLRQDAAKPVNGSKALYGHGRLSPTWVKDSPKHSPLMLYSWEQTEASLHALRDREGSPYEGIALEYTHPLTGGPVTPTIGCGAQLIRKGEKLKARRVAGSSIFTVVKGKGRTLIEGKAFDWEKGDIIAIPSWAKHEHANTGGEDAIFFSINDWPVMRTLGLYREEAA
jgi:gentisate 1,2-dioxygenase